MTASRAELLRLVAELSEADPDLRLGQMLTNLATLARGPATEAVWDAEDDELAAAARRLLARLRERRTAPTGTATSAG
ncbi:MAG: hypothetical protein K2X87_29610 [Gemmataceae bacterium]|nr:hypothetical protein [Gemmataceae bacterium]